jgi:hypothetical protein
VPFGTLPFVPVEVYETPFYLVELRNNQGV